jgi:cyclophilin family peptidyl-prolyl cis-trans isomerase
MTLRPLAPILCAVAVAASACGVGSPPRIPGPEFGSAVAPDSFEVVFRTSTGNWTAVFHSAWSPEGATRVWELARRDVWAGARFYRVNPRVVQFGYSGDPLRDSVWRSLTIDDDPVVESNSVGRISFARGGPDTRSFQLFVNRVDNGGPEVERFDYDTCCDGGYPPVGEIREGLDAFEAINDEYGEAPPQDSIRFVGNEFLRRAFPRLDSIIGTDVVREWR